MKKKAELGRQEIHKILRRHEGSISELARDLDVRVSTVSNCLRDRISSRRILDAAREMAQGLLTLEPRNGAPE
jgi:hypothetical protein